MLGHLYTRAVIGGFLFVMVFAAANARAQTPAPAVQNTIPCVSEPGQRQLCPADTSAGVALVRSTGAAPCLLGKTWGYDDTGIWVSDGCGGEFIAGQTAEEPTKGNAPEYVPNAGFLLLDGEKGQIYFRLFSYVRYLNQRNLDAVLHGRVRRRTLGAAAAGHAASEVLRAVLRLVSDAEGPLLPVRVVVKRIARRSRAGRRAQGT